jgi:hypothetical protein
MALLSVNGIYATDENQNISNISENTTIGISNSTDTSNSEISAYDSISSGDDTENNLTENETGSNSTADNVTSIPTNPTGAAGADTIADETLTNVQALFVWSTSLSTIDPSYLASVGITDIYVYIPRTGANIGSFIEKFAGSGIRVWAWIPCFVDDNGNWIIAGESTLNGVDAREWIKQVINNTVTSYDVEGVLLDYCRYPGTAFKHPSEAGATQIITNFVADVRTLLDAKSAEKGSYIYLGVCVMPECAANTYYYGQSYEQLSQYVDCLVPMIYKGNYGEDTSWIGSTTSYIVNHSTVPVVAAVQTYESDSNATPINGSELTSDVQTAIDNNASGYALFRYGLVSSYPEINGSNFTIEEILKAAETVKNYIETNKTLPTTITIGTTTINMAQFLYLATTATTQLNNGKPTTTTITLGDYTLPNTSNEQLTTELLFKEDYVDFARRIAEFIEGNNVAPIYGYANIGQVGYQSQIYIYSRILTYYKTNNVLPSNIVVKSWSTANIPTTGINVTFTIDQIADTATGVKNNVEIYKYLPTTANVAGIRISIAQFLYLATQAIVQINSGSNNPISLANYDLPSSSYESMSSGTLSKADYVDFASRVAGYMVTNKMVPSYGVVGLGSLGYQTQIYIFSQVLSSYKQVVYCPVRLVPNHG